MSFVARLDLGTGVAMGGLLLCASTCIPEVMETEHEQGVDARRETGSGAVSIY